MGMNSVISSGGASAGPSTSAVNYVQAQCSKTASGPWNSTEARVKNVIPNVNGTIGPFYFEVDTAPGVGKQYTFTVRKNGVDTSLSIVISGTNKTGSDTNTGHYFTVAPGDTVTISSTPASTPAAFVNHSWTLGFAGNNANESLVMRGTSTQHAANTTSYYEVQSEGGGNATEVNRTSPMPTPGSLSGLYLVSDVDPGGVAQTIVVTLMVNGVASALTATINTGSTTANDVANSVTLAQNDTVSWRVASSALAAASRLSISAKWAPTTDGESLGFAGRTASIAQNSTFYKNGRSAWDNEVNVQMKVLACVIKFLSVLAANIASGQTFTCSSRVNGGAGALTKAITGTASTGNDNTNSDTVAAGDLFNVKGVTSATSGTVSAGASWVYYIAPAASTVKQLAAMGVG